MQATKIEFRKERDFTTVLGDSFLFLKQNFKPLFSAVILVVGPVILLTGLAYAFLQIYITNNLTSGSGNFLGTMYFIYMGAMYLLMLINSVLLNSVVFNYMCLYQEKPAGERISVPEVASRVWKNLGRVFVSMLILLLMLLGLIMVVSLIGLGFGSMGVFGIIIIALAIIFGALIYAPILTYYISAGFFVVVRDGMLTPGAFGKVRRYMVGNFWWTWLIMIVVIIGLSIVQVAFNLPASILSMTQTFSRVRHISEGSAMTGGDHSVLLIICYTLGRFLSSCSFVVQHLICAFNFLSHEEKQEGVGMITKIEEIQ